MSYHRNPDGTQNRNMVGDVVVQKRNEVDDIRDNVCSNGLHFCSLSYIPKYHGGTGRVMIVKINPADVVSIPSDYDNAKGRCCKYTVIGEHTDPEKEYKQYTESAVVGSDGQELEYDDRDCPDCGCELDECVCDLCPDCGYHVDECECDEVCDDCGELIGNCVCEPELEPEVDLSTLGIKPDGSRFHNLRDKFGRFLRRK